MATFHCRSAFISDVHLGTPDCKASYLLDFLRKLRCEKLYLVGDIIDMDNYILRATWGSAPVTGTAWRYFDLGSGQAITQRLTNLGLSPSLYNPASFANGYYAESTGLSTGTSARTAQRSEFIEDHWQLTDRWNIYLGLRNEQFTNYNGVGAAYAKERNQLDPRLGFAWDVYGDSSLKVYGNAGRYHLGLPTSVAVRGAGPSTFPSTYYSFTSIDPVTGVPQGLSVGAPWSQTFYNNGANGTPPDAKTVSVKDLKTYYQDEYILGFDKQLPNNWTVGAKAMKAAVNRRERGHAGIRKEMTPRAISLRTCDAPRNNS